MDKRDFIHKYKGTYRQFLCYKMIQQEIDGLNKASLKKPIRILDIGCFQGFGFDKGRFLQLFSRHIEKHGADIVPLDNIPPDIFFQQCDFSKNTNYEDDFFDIIFAGEVIEHIFDTDLFLKEIYRILRPTGLFVLTTPNSASLDNLLLWLRKEQLSFIAYSIDESKHIRAYSPKSLIQHLKERSFCVEDIKTSEHYVAAIKIIRLGRINQWISIICEFLYKTILPLRGAHIIVKARKI